MKRNTNFYRVLGVNFISALIISFVACFFLATYKLHDVMHIGNIFGLYFLVVYGIDILVESREIPNNYKRFLYVIGLTIVFDVVYLFLVPLFFGADVFAVYDYIIMVVNGAQFDLVFNAKVYLALFGILMLIFNFILYRHDRAHGV